MYCSLRAFFLGGVDELVSIKTAGYSDTLKKISRIGMQGVNGGTITIKLNVILHHSHPVIKDKVKIGEARKVFLFQDVDAIRTDSNYSINKLYKV